MHGVATAAREGRTTTTTTTLKSLSVVRATDGFIGPATGVFLYNTLYDYTLLVCVCVHLIHMLKAAEAHIILYLHQTCFECATATASNNNFDV